VYRGTWTNIDIAAKEYLAVDDCEVSPGENPSELAMQRARVRVERSACIMGQTPHKQLSRGAQTGVVRDHQQKQERDPFWVPVRYH
jgi:hypothetical protein